MTRYVSLFLIIALILMALPVATASTAHAARKARPQESAKNVSVKTGAEVAAKVQQLKNTNYDVYVAFRQFERNGARPQIENAVSLSGDVESGAPRQEASKRKLSMRKASFAHQQITVRENGVELIFIPTISTATEWQGTMIARLYNESEQLIFQEVFNLVMVQEDPNVAHWRPVYETSIYEGQPYLYREEDMYASFALGVPIAQHPAVTGSAPSLVPAPWQLLLEPPPPFEPEPCPPTMICPILPIIVADNSRSARTFSGDAIFQKAAYKPAYSLLSQPSQGVQQVRHTQRCPWYCRPPVIQPDYIIPRVRAGLRDSFVPCSYIAAGCGIASAIFAQAPLLPCFVQSCSAVVLYQVGRRFITH